MATHPTRRVHTPTILQMEAVECGAVALAIMLGYHGRFVPLDILRTECGISRDGSKASNIVKVSKRYGLNATGFRRSADQVLAGPFPTIVFWRFNHFLVVEGVRGDRVFLNDPATGPRVVARSSFEEDFSGIVLQFEKTEAFEPGGPRPKLFERLADRAKNYRRPLMFILLLSVLIALPSFIVPGFTAIFVNDVLIDGYMNWLPALVVGVAGAIVILLLLSWLKEMTVLRLQTGMSLDRSAAFVWHVLRLPASFFEQRYLGDIANRVTTVQQVAQLLTTQLGMAAVGGVTALVLLILTALIDPILSIVAVVGILTNGIVIWQLNRVRTDAAIRLRTDQGKLFATSIIGIKTIETLKSMGAENDFFGKWAGHHAKVVNSQQRLARLAQASIVIPPLTAIMTLAVALAVGGLRVIDGALTIGALIAFQSLFMLITAPVQELVETAGQGQEAAADLARLDDVFDTPLDWRHQPVEEPCDAPDETPGLQLRDITFGYAPLEAPLIDGFAVDLVPGGWLALVGMSGSGKSTVSKLVSGLYKPWRGDVLIDGRPLSTHDRRELAQLLAVVQQDIALFEGTIAENISLWDRTIPLDVIVEAVRDAQLDDVVAAMPGGIDGVIEEGGRNLSGGERQRIEIARALAHAPSMLILDEATSALDPVTEAEIMRAVRRRGMTCLVIAHRLSTIRDCDEIVVLDKGKVVERGRHDDLMAAAGPYARLIADETTA